MCPAICVRMKKQVGRIQFWTLCHEIPWEFTCFPCSLEIHLYVMYILLTPPLMLFNGTYYCTSVNIYLMDHI